MRIELLGRVRAVGDDGSPLEIRGARLRVLLARLALDPGRVVPADALVDDLWAAGLPADAANALQALVSRLRKALGGPETVESVAGGYRLAARAEDVDAHRFEDLLARGRKELAADRPQAASTLLTEALGLWRGPALEDLDGAAFAGASAARLEELRAAAAEERFEAELRLGRHAEILADLEAAGARHPLRERLAALRMRALTSAGRQAEALAVYENVRAALADQLGVDPGQELREAHLAVLRGSYDRPAARAEPRLPARLTSFVGRDEELRTVLTLMEGSRLVTVVGPGGAGKTRLAVEAVVRHRAYRDGRLWFVPLAGVETADRLADAVLGALRSADLRPPDGRSLPADPAGQVAELLAGGEAVLVLDNCERLVDGVAELVYALLGRLPYLIVLAVSREPLAITGEALCPLGPLGREAAVRLFTDRALSVRPGLAPDPEAVADICRRLDGLPLALELAAARLRSMSVEQVARRLDDRFRLLTSGDRVALPHQRTLHAVVQWSWDLLSEPERALARRFSAFQGGVDEGAVSAVCAEQDGPYVLDALVEKSIVEAAGGRYRMLETVRAFAAEELARSGEQEAVGDRLIDHFTRLAEAQEPLLHTRDQLGAFAVFDAEYDNMVVALRSAIAAGDAGAAARLTVSLFWYWNVRYDARAENFMAEVLQLGDALPERPRAAITAMHELANDHSRFPGAERIRTLIGDCVRTGAMEDYWVLVPVILGTAFTQGLDDLAERELRRALEHHEPWVRACAHWVEAFVLVERGDWQAGTRARAVALRGFEELGERYGMAWTLLAAAQSASVDGDHGTALEHYRRGVTVATELGAGEEIWHRTWLAAELVRAGDATSARREIEAVRRRAEGGMRRHSEMELHRRIADLHRRAGELDQAERALDDMEALARELSVEEEAIENLVAPDRMAILLAAGQAGRARALLPAAVSGTAAQGATARAAELLARLLLLEGDPAGAATALGLSAAIRGAFDRGEPELAALAEDLRARLGTPEYDRAYRRGAELPRQDALASL
ncbi:BTAD domain-containing putative transcriptional regulator [Nonomuraea endophytica]|uniref:BTAD domain-containing putative transcriptional regulator n=1 Tax=Nonomuraea endophytica TaxID=714136 RepID=UPI0037C6E69B